MRRLLGCMASLLVILSLQRSSGSLTPSGAALESAGGEPGLAQDTHASGPQRALLSSCGTSEADACVLSPAPNAVIGKYTIQTNHTYNVTSCSEGFSFWILAMDASNYKINVNVASSILCTVRVFGASLGRNGAVYVDLDQAAASAETTLSDSAPGLSTITNDRLRVTIDHVDDLSLRTKAASVLSETEQQTTLRLTGSSTVKFIPVESGGTMSFNVTANNTVQVSSFGAKPYTVTQEQNGVNTLQFPEGSSATLVSVDCGPAVSLLPVWQIGVGERATATSTVNITSASSTVVVFRDGQLPNLAATGLGSISISASFYGPTWAPSWQPTTEHNRELTLENTGTTTLTIVEQSQLSTVTWAAGLDPSSVSIDLYNSRTRYNHSAPAADGLVLIKVMPDAYFEATENVLSSAAVDANAVQIDEAYRVVMEQGAGYSLFPVPANPVNITVTCGPAITSTTPTWHFGKGDATAAVATINMTSTRANVQFHTDGQLANLTATGQGTVFFTTGLLADQTTSVTAGGQSRQLVIDSSSIGWTPSIDAHVRFDLHQGHTNFYAVEGAVWDNLVLIVVKAAATLDFPLSVKLAEVDKAICILDETFKIVLEAGTASIPPIKIDTMTGRILVTCSTTDRISTDPCGPGSAEPVWTFYKGLQSAASATLNFTSSSSNVFVHTTDRLPNMNATGQGNATVRATFLANQARSLLTNAPPAAQLNISDGFPASSVSWAASVSATLMIETQQGNTRFQLNNEPLEHTILGHALSSAATTLVVPVDLSDDSTVVSADHQDSAEYHNTVTVTRDNITHLVLHSDVFRTNLEIVGNGFAAVRKNFHETHERQLLIGQPPMSHVVISDPRTVDSTVVWGSGVTTELDIDVHRGHTLFNLSACKHTNVIDLTAKQGSTLTIVDPVWESAEISGNVMLIDKALRVLVEYGSVVNTVPIDTMTIGSANVSLEVAEVPSPPSVVSTSIVPLNSFQFSEVITTTTTVDFLHTWVLGSGLKNAAITTLNFTSASSIASVHTIDRLPSVQAIGQGDGRFEVAFWGNSQRHLLVGIPPDPHLTIKDGLPSSVVSWDTPSASSTSNVKGTLVIDLHHGRTNFQLDGNVFDPYIGVNVYDHAKLSVADENGQSETHSKINIAAHQTLLENSLLVSMYSDDTEAISPLATDASSFVAVTIGDAARRASTSTVWRMAGSDNYMATQSDSVSITSTEGTIIMSTPDVLPTINVAGSGTATIATKFGIGGSLNLDLDNLPSPQVVVRYPASSSTLQWASSLSVTLSMEPQISASLNFLTSKLAVPPIFKIAKGIKVDFNLLDGVGRRSDDYLAQAIRVYHGSLNFPDIMPGNIEEACVNAIQQCSRSMWADEYIRELELGQCSDTDHQCSSYGENIVFSVDTEEPVEIYNNGDRWDRVSAYDSKSGYIQQFGVNTADTEFMLQCHSWKIEIGMTRSLFQVPTYPMILLFVFSILYAIMRFIIVHEVSIQSLYCLSALALLPVLQTNPLPLHLRALTQAADVSLSDWWYLLDYIDCNDYGYYQGLLAVVFAAIMMLAASWYRITHRNKNTFHVVYCCPVHGPHAAEGREALQRSIVFKLLDNVPPEERKGTLAMMSPDQQASAIWSMEALQKEATLDAMSPHEQARVLSVMSRHRRSVVLAAIGTEKQAVALAAMPPKMREAALQGIPEFRQQEVWAEVERLLAERPAEFTDPEDIHMKEDLEMQSDPQANAAVEANQGIGITLSRQANPIWGAGHKEDGSEQTDEGDCLENETASLSPRHAASGGVAKTCQRCCGSCLWHVFESDDLEEKLIISKREEEAAAGALRRLLETMYVQGEKTEVLLAMDAAEQAASLATLGPEETSAHLAIMNIEDKAAVLDAMTPDERMAALNRMTNLDERHQLSAWRICSGCVLIGVSYVYALWLITAGVAHIPRAAHNSSSAQSSLYAGFFISAICVCSLYVLFCTLWPHLTANDADQDPQGQRPYVKCHKVLLVAAMVLFGILRRSITNWEAYEHSTMTLVLVVFTCFEIVFAILDYITRIKMAPVHDYGQTHNGWRTSLVLSSLFGHCAGISMVFSVRFQLGETVSIACFLLYWGLTCASESVIYMVSYVAEQRTVFHDERYSLSQNFRRFTFYFHLRDRFVALIWVGSFTLCMMAIPTWVYSVLTVLIISVLGWMYQYVYHCWDYRSRLNRIPEVDWSKFPDASDDEESDFLDEDDLKTGNSYSDGTVDTELSALRPGVRTATRSNI